MNIEIKLSDREDAYIIKNLWPLYQHEVSEFETSLVTNRHGLFAVDDSVTTLARHADEQNAWWRAPDSLFPYLIRVDGYPAGFNLVAGRPHLPQGVEADFVVHEFFVLHTYRGKGVADRAAIDGFNMHRGKWEIVTWPANARAIAFWRRVVSSYTAKGHFDKEIDHPWGRRVALRFDNSGEPSNQPMQRTAFGRL
jgi:aminoglycoside 6'-N-acetyltransferase I